jgi:HlyD family secretion protein
MPREPFDDNEPEDWDIPSLREAYPSARSQSIAPVNRRPPPAPPPTSPAPAPVQHSAPMPYEPPPQPAVQRAAPAPTYEPWEDGRRRRASDDPRFDMLLGAAACIVFFAGFIGWASTAPLDAAVIAPGVVMSAGNRQTVQHREGGTIAELHVREGQTVSVGEVLIELSTTETRAEKESLTSQLFDLQLQRAQLIADSEGRASVSRPAEWETLDADEKELADAAMLRHQREMAARRAAQSGGGETDARILGLRNQIAALDQQEVLLQDELAGLRELAAEQLVPLTRVRALERSLADLQGQRGALRASIGEVQEDKAELRRRVEARIAEITPQLAALRSKVENARVRAPVGGDVVGLKFNTVGGVIRPGEPVMDIVPEGEDLVVRAQIRPQDADDLRPGMAAEVRITAFQGRDQPVFDAVVQSVSADRLTDPESGQAYFEATVEVAEGALANQVDHAGNLRELKAGLPAEVIVATRKRTALQYFIEPLTQVIRVSGREE